MQHLNIMITAGPTREPLDPVRYITNHSSGKMGFAIAAAPQAAGERHAGERAGCITDAAVCPANRCNDRAGNGSGGPAKRSAAADFYWLCRRSRLSCRRHR
ncbi:hypothetical protein DMH27_13880 [Raoultella planticola]|nr:hypothetical protein [Raoultella planticola]